jgi:hypothetical protein
MFKILLDNPSQPLEFLFFKELPEHVIAALVTGVLIISGKSIRKWFPK